MDICTKDKKLLQIRSQIKKNRNDIIIGMSELSKIKNNDTFLEKIFNDYKEYYENTVEIKKKQITQIENIIKYLEKNIDETNMPKNLLKQIRHEQNNLFTTLDAVNDDLQKIESLKK